MRLSFFGLPRRVRLRPPDLAPENGARVAALLDLVGTKASVVPQRGGEGRSRHRCDPDGWAGRSAGRAGGGASDLRSALQSADHLEGAVVLRRRRPAPSAAGGAGPAGGGGPRGGSGAPAASASRRAGRCWGGGGAMRPIPLNAEMAALARRIRRWPSGPLPGLCEDACDDRGPGDRAALCFGGRVPGGAGQGAARDHRSAVLGVLEFADGAVSGAADAAAAGGVRGVVVLPRVPRRR